MSRRLLQRLAARLPNAPRTRFAPAPTGNLHLGHVVNALLVWGAARALGGTVILRVEDHDGTRARAAYERALLDDLAWLELEADEGAPPALCRQSERATVYRSALAQLDAAGLVYACDCSRRTRAAAGQPALPGEELRYPGHCRMRALPESGHAGLRVRLPPDSVTFIDANLGLQQQTPAAQCGDLLLRDRQGHWTYQFAVVADDGAQRVDLVIRGRDLLASTGRQILLGRLLGRPEPPVYLHHALLVHPDGAKLAKSRGSTGIAELRHAGHSAADVRGLAAALCGLQPAPRPLPVHALPELLGAALALPGDDAEAPDQAGQPS